jgi:predicted acetyltransferase
VRKRVIQFGSHKLPIADVCQLVVLPEFRSRGLGAQLLQEAERLMAHEDAAFGMVSTSAPRFFEAYGWSIAGRPCYSSACPRDVLAQLQVSSASPTTLLGNTRRALNIRLWRHVEQAALMRLYAQNIEGRWGANERTEAYWRWLVTRRAFDRIYVAIDGPDNLELDDEQSPIVGYAVMREGCIVELVSSPLHASAAEQLLARACADAIEHDQHMVSLHAPPDSPMHEVIRANRGSRAHPGVHRDQVLMVKLFDSVKLLQGLTDDVYERAKCANLRRPCELGLNVAGERLTLNVGKRKARVIAGKLGRSYLALDQGLLGQLLLGQIDVRAAVAAGHVEASTRTAVETAAVLFPRLPFWRPPLDYLES